MNAQLRRVSCSQCPSSYELLPPADMRYSIPREKPTSNDYIQRIYECDEEHHRNTIYWERIPPPVIVSGSYQSDLTRGYRDTYGVIV